MLLFRTPVGTVVFDRDFGIDWSFLDLPLPQAKAKLTVEYINKVKKYEPTLKVSL
jgi:phage baseplate assembly protein W